MNDFPILRLALAASLLVIPACGDDEPAGPATSFTASLSGGQQVPAVQTPASGSADLTVTGNQITYTVNVQNIQDVILAHIHVAQTGQNGPVRLNLCGTGAPEPACTSGTGVLATGTNGATVGGITFDSLLSAMRTGGAYVNVHTSSEGCTPGQPGCNGGGEIRGQVEAN